MNRENILILFFKYPEQGKVKTRLAQSIGELKALGVYKSMLNDLFDNADPVSAKKIAACSVDKVQVSGNFKYDYFPQEGPNLGERMLHAFKTVFQMEYKKTVLIGSDCPEVTTALLTEAFESLDSHDYVIGPSSDGGYYLIGMKKEVLSPSVFDAIPWSTSRVLELTLGRLESEKYTCKLLKELNDIDTIEDAKAFYKMNSKNNSSHTIKYLSGMGKVNNEI